MPTSRAILYSTVHFIIRGQVTFCDNWLILENADFSELLIFVSNVSRTNLRLHLPIRLIFTTQHSFIEVLTGFIKKGLTGFIEVDLTGLIIICQALIDAIWLLFRTLCSERRFNETLLL